MENLRALLIESDPQYASELGAMFGQIRTHVTLRPASQLQSGMAALAEDNFQVILADSELPDSSGLDTLRTLRSACPSVPIIMLTSKGQQPAVICALEAEADDCLVKHQFDAQWLDRSIQYAIERKRLLLENRRLAEDLERANRSKHEFAGVVAHELRTPLQGILGWAVLLRDGRMSPDSTMRALASIEQNARDQDRIIDDLLDMSRIAGGKLTLKMDSLGLGDVIQAAVESVRESADAKQITIATNLATDVPPLMGDSRRIQQAMRNLLSNSVRFTPQNGRISITLRYKPPVAEIDVVDGGIAIPATRAHGGLGISLDVVRRVVEMHGGTVDVFGNAEQKGAAFSLRFPNRTGSRILAVQ